MTPVERHVRLATTVDDLPAAWVFVMEALDEVGQTPSIEIQARWCSDDDFTVAVYDVSVSGHVAMWVDR